MMNLKVLDQVLTTALSYAPTLDAEEEMRKEMSHISELIGNQKDYDNVTFYLRKATSVCRDDKVEFVGNYFILTRNTNIASTNGIKDWFERRYEIAMSFFMVEVEKGMNSVREEYKNSGEVELIEEEISAVKAKLYGVIEDSYTCYARKYATYSFHNSFEFKKDSALYLDEPNLYWGKRLILTTTQEFSNEPGGNDASYLTKYCMYMHNWD